MINGTPITALRLATRQRYRVNLWTLLLLLALVMTISTAACGLIYLEVLDHQEESRPRRTRPPVSPLPR